MTPRPSPVSHVSYLGLSFTAPDGNPDWPAVTVHIDGKAFASVVAPGWSGFDPGEILGPHSPLLPVHPWRRTAVYRCSCRTEGCGVIAPLIAAPTPDVVTWTDFRDYTGVFTGPTPLGGDPTGGREWDLPALRFSAGQYLAEIQRATADRSWETPRRATARQVKPLVEDLLTQAGQTDIDAISVHPAHQAEGITITLRHQGLGGTGRWWEYLRIEVATDDPEQAARSLAITLAATPVAHWGNTFGYDPRPRRRS